MQLTRHFTLKEFTQSNTAQAEGIDNTAPPEVIQNLRSLCVKVLQPLRDFVNRPVEVNSGYRSEALNDAVGGVPNSFHLDGLAADVEIEGLTAKDLESMIEATSLPVEECIAYPDTGHVHIAVNKQRIS